ncbi:MAG: hypothetical protein LBR90_00425, partial [Elusimicrobiota bacterium]|nr:hypothetical protein [Elusimicrobiota bacterium]
IIINLEKGAVSKCYYTPEEQNIFEDLSKPLIFEPIGYNCPKPHCALNYNWHGTGIIPELDICTYGKMMERPNTYNPKLVKLLDFKFADVYKTRSDSEKIKISQNVKKRFAQGCALCGARPEINFKNKIRLRIYNHLKRKLERKGLICK